MAEKGQKREGETSGTPRVGNGDRRRLSLNPFMLLIVSTFVAYLIYLSIVGTEFNYNLTLALSPYFAERGFWPLTQITSWFISEISGLIGVFVRLAGGLFAFYSVFLLIRKKKIFLKIVNKAIILEAVHYLFVIPWILFLLFGSPTFSVFSQGKYVGFSYLAQVLLVFPALIVLSFKIKRYKIEENSTNVLKWVGTASSLFVFALWIRHALFWVYALWANGANLNGIVQIVGFSNSMFTLLVAAVATLVVCLPLIREKSKRPSPISIGAILIIIGTHFIIYDLVALAEPLYLSFLSLTEFWYVVLPILGFGLINSGAYDSASKKT